ncbi:DUF2752 domain-containing protein [Hamadaea sp. NPDC050747]|uniref:DUF2752 domain-containing protein n=1 Tax=Hamadaea sp. NPDC050747 TaxID=3155789 RepID=UPI0033DC3CE9
MTQVESAPPGQLVVAAPDRVTAWFLRRSAALPAWAGPAAALVCIAGALGYTQITDPTTSAAGDPPSCLLKLTTGFDCPGCGGTRAAWYLMHGDLAAAARHHLLFVFAVPFLIYAYVAWAGKKVFNKQLPQLRVSPKMIAWFLAIWGVFTILRNLPWAPFTWLYV